MEKKQRIILTVLAVLGILLSLDLTYIFFKVNFIHNAAASFCSVSQLIDCDGVAKTGYSMVLGVPLALWGLLLYLTMLFLTFVDKIQAKFKNTIFDVFKNPNSYIATLGLVSFALSIILALISIFAIKKICVLCFVTYFIDLLIAFFAKSKGFFGKDIKNTVFDFIDGFKKYTTLAIAVIAAFSGLLYYLNDSLILSPIAQHQKNFVSFIEMKANPYAVQGNVLGNEKGEIKVVIYSDFMCPFCKTMNIIVHKAAQNTKNANFIHSNYPLDDACNPYVKNIHPGACELARFALAAEKQGKYWGMVNAIYDNQPQNKDAVLFLATSIGLDAKQLEKDATSREIKEALAQQIESAHKAQINGTPSLVILDIRYSGAMPYDDLISKIKQAEGRYRRDNAQKN